MIYWSGLEIFDMYGMMVLLFFIEYVNVYDF